MPVAVRAPNMNAYAERWVQSIKHECLNHFIVFGEDHLRHLISSYVTYYNEERPHQGRGNRPLRVDVAPNEVSADTSRIVCDQRLGGLLKHYRYAA